MNAWNNMPEFVQDKLEPFKKIKVTFVDDSYIFVRFNCKADYDLYLYGSCGNNLSTGSEYTNVETLIYSWSDTSFSDDSRDFWIQIRFETGAGGWTLSTNPGCF